MGIIIVCSERGDGDVCDLNKLYDFLYIRLGFTPDVAFLNPTGTGEIEIAGNAGVYLSDGLIVGNPGLFVCVQLADDLAVSYLVEGWDWGVLGFGFSYIPRDTAESDIAAKMILRIEEHFGAQNISRIVLHFSPSICPACFNSIDLIKSVAASAIASNFPRLLIPARRPECTYCCKESGASKFPSSTRRQWVDEPAQLFAFLLGMVPG